MPCYVFVELTSRVNSSQLNWTPNLFYNYLSTYDLLSVNVIYVFSAE